MLFGCEYVLVVCKHMTENQTMFKALSKTLVLEFFWKIIYFQSKINEMFPYKTCKKRDNVKTLNVEGSEKGLYSV